MRKRLAVAAAICAAFATAPTHAAVMWNFNYIDAGVGFNDAAEGAARRGALQSAADYVSSFLTSYTATLQIDVNGAVTADTKLASAGSEFNAPFPGNGFAVQGDVMLKILGGDGADPSAGTKDGTVDWNFQDFTWELGNDFQAGEFDFFSTAVHELLHAIGFASEIQETGFDGFGDAPGTAGAWAPFDKFLTAFDGTPIIDPSTFVLDKTKWDQARLSDDGDLISGCGAGILFTGSNAVAANGGNAVQIYSPKTWEAGSSGSHLDDNCYTPDPPGGTSHYMMEAQTVDGLGIRTISDLEVGMFRDIGYTQFGAQSNGAVPEPSTILLLLGSLGVLGVARRRKAR